MDNNEIRDGGPAVDGQYLDRLQPDWPKEPDLRDLKLDLENTKQSHSTQVAKIDKWNRLVENPKPVVGKGRSSVAPKMIRRQAEWRYSALSEPFLGSNKICKVEPTTFEDVAAAKQAERLVNWQFRTKLNRVKLIDQFVRICVDEGTAIMRLGWTRSTITVQVPRPVVDFFPMESEEQVAAFQQALALKDENPRGYEENVPEEMKAAISFFEETGQATVGVVTGSQMVDEEKILENKPVVDILNPRNFYVDPTCEGDLDKANFVVVSFETNKAELNKSPGRYKNLEFVEWASNAPVSSNDHASTTPDTFNFNDPLRRKVVAYEYWGWHDIKGDGTLTPIVATWIGNVLIRLEENPMPDGKLPFVIANYLPVKRDLYGEPDAELLEDHQAILGAVTRGMIDLIGRSANGQQGMAKGMLDPVNKSKFMKGEDYEFNPQQNPQNNYIEHRAPEIPQSAVHGARCNYS